MACVAMVSKIDASVVGPASAWVKEPSTSEHSIARATYATAATLGPIAMTSATLAEAIASATVASTEANPY